MLKHSTKRLCSLDNKALLNDDYTNFVTTTENEKTEIIIKEIIESIKDNPTELDRRLLNLQPK